MAIKKASVATKIGDSNKKEEAALSAMEQIRAKFGEGSIMKFGDARKTDVDAIPTGCLSLDIALGIGGIPRGRVIEIFGPESSGKTTLAQHVVAEVQKLGGIAAFVDAEHALDPLYAEKIGVNIKENSSSTPLDLASTSLRVVSDANIWQRLKEGLLKDWSRP